MKRSILHPLKYGSLTLAGNCIYAPLAGCSNYPFRMVASHFNPDLMYCEMVKMDALIRYDERTFELLDYDDAMRPIGAQLVGSDPKKAYDAAQIIEQLGFDTIDLNCGCPVDKVTKDGSGSGLLQTPEKIGSILKAIVDAVSIPVTVKIRAGWSGSDINGALITQIAEDAGAVAISVHGRTRKQAYKGPANYAYIKECKDVANSILVIGNGDLFDPLAVERMYNESQCDGFLFSRGTLGGPWIAEDVRHYFATGELITRSSEEVLDTLKKHFEYVKHHKAPKRAVLEMRKAGCWYLKNREGISELRRRMSTAQSLEEVGAIIASY